jgi:hypothetical protein
MALIFGTNCPKDTGMSKISSFKDVIGLWDSQEALASDMGLNLPAVRKWWQRDSIPVGWWPSVIGSSIGRKNGLSAKMFVGFVPLPRPLRAEVRA